MADKQYKLEGRKRKKKKKAKHNSKANVNKHVVEEVDTDEFSSEPPEKAIKCETTIQISQQPCAGRQFTVSVALPGSILDNAQSPELRTYLAGQIARALVVFNVDEVIVFSESGKHVEDGNTQFQGVGKKTDANVLLARILQYLECPQYLRKCFFPKHSDLQYAGILNPLDSPHHMRMDDNSLYREGVTLNRPTKNGKGSFVNAGMRKEVKIDKHIKSGVRVTVKMDQSSNADAKTYRGTVVAPSSPRVLHGIYWGYTVRLAPTFGSVFTQCPYSDGYDIMIGTSERGTHIDGLHLPAFKHLLVVFGGLKGLEASLESDENLQVSDPSLLFNHYVNTCPGQGSRTIRTEEAILITMAAIKPLIEKANNWKYAGHNFDSQ